MRKVAMSLYAAALASGAVLAGGPRTAADAVTPVSRLGWDLWKARYEEKLAEIRSGRHYDVVFVGDSITHYWERDCPASWQKWMGKYNPLNLGILADETQHVLWRLTEGGQLDGYGPRAFVLLIGTNNVGNNPPGAEKPEWAVAGVKKLIKTIRAKHGGVPILLMAILPRSRDNDLKCGYPKANAEINRQLRQLADGKSVHWLDCGQRFLTTRVRNGMPIVDTKLMADSLHPTEQGYEILGEEISRKLDELLSPAPGTVPWRWGQSPGTLGAVGTVPGTLGAVGTDPRTVGTVPGVVGTGPGTVALWPAGKAPDYQAAQREAEMIVTLPKRRTTDALLIVAPGGSYEKLCTWEDERAAWFSAHGMATAQLRYRVPRPQGAPKHRAAWQDAQRAVRLVRAHAREWGVDPEKIGFLGHSAGGHLAVLMATSGSVSAYAPVDAVDKLSSQVNFAIPCYPAYLIDDSGQLDAAFAFDSIMPPTCFFHGDADGFSVGSLAVATKMKRLGVPLEMHLFTHRAHADLPWEECMRLVWSWLEKIEMVGAKQKAAGKVD